MARRAKGKATKPTPTKPRRRARQGVLPGTESVRSEKLDAICESIGDERDAMNKARTETQALIGAALDIMTKKNLTVYRHDKIELARIPGADKLRVRVTKEEGDADDTDNDAEDLGDGNMAGVQLRDGVQAEH
jgi:hypothetical protein